MDTSTIHTKDLRSKIGKIAIAIAFAVVMCGVVGRPAMADRDDHHRHGRQHQKWHDRGSRHEHRPDVIYNYAPSPYVYYAPPPVVYAPVPPPASINLFFRIP